MSRSRRAGPEKTNNTRYPRLQAYGNNPFTTAAEMTTRSSRRVEAPWPAVSMNQSASSKPSGTYPPNAAASVLIQSPIRSEPPFLNNRPAINNQQAYTYGVEKVEKELVDCGLPSYITSGRTLVSSLELSGFRQLDLTCDGIDLSR